MKHAIMFACVYPSTSLESHIISPMITLEMGVLIMNIFSIVFFPKKP